MISEAKIAVRNAGLLVMQKGSQVLTGALFAVLIPRLMGSETFGKYALLTSMSVWFALVSSISSAQTMGRFVPPFVYRGDNEGLRKFVGNFLCLRLLNGVTVASLYLFVTILWFPEFDFSAVFFIAGAIVFRTIAKLIFALFLGLNNAARWALGETLNRWASLILIVPGFYFGRLPGACLGVMLAELAILLTGLFWARAYLSLSAIRWDRNTLAAYRSFGITLFFSNVLFSLSELSGELLIRVFSGDYAQVGYFGVAYRTYSTIAVAIWQLTMAFCPLFMTLKTQGDTASIARWVGFLLKWTAAVGIILFFGALLVGDAVVPLAFGKDYRPVAANLLLLTAALLIFALGSVARLLTLTYDRPGLTLQAALLHLLTFWGAGIPLVAWRGSLAGCLAVFLATIVYVAYLTWRIRAVAHFSLSTWWMPILVGAFFLPLAWFRASWQVNILLFMIFIAGYTAALFFLRVVTPGELANVRVALSSDVLTQRT